MDIRRIGTGGIPDIVEEQQQGAQGGKQAGQAAESAAADSIEAPAISAFEKIFTPLIQKEPISLQATPGEVRSVLQALVGGATRLPDADRMPYFDQGTQNACGTTTLAEIMSYLGVPESKDDIDSAIRRMNIFTSPNDMIDFARDHGLKAEGYNHGSWDEVKSMIDQGHPVQALIQADITYPDGSSIKGQHYIAIEGYQKDPVTGEDYVLYHDPNIGDDPNTAANEGVEQRMKVSDFMKMWGDVGFGFDNYFIAYAKGNETLPPGRDDGLEGVLGTLDGVTNMTNGLSRIGDPDSFGSFVHGIPEFIGGLVQTVGCGIGGALQLGGQALNDAVEGIPVLENFVQPFGDLVDGAGAVIGDLVNGFGEAADDFGGAFESLFDGDVGGFFGGIGDSIGDVATGVVDAVGDAVSAVGDAISDFFSGW
jgi:hypothetical protein